MKVMTIIGTRPEIIKMSRVIPRLDEQVNHILVHTGQNYDYELNEIFFKQLEVRKPNYFLNTVAGNLAETIGNIITEADKVLEKENPDALLILGDTNSALSVIPAKRRKIPIFHMEAGNRCFDQRVPEEINRKIVDHVSDINLPYTEHARRYLLREGLPPDQIIKTGSPQKEILDYYRDSIESSDVLDRLGLSEKEYFAVSIHREENVDDSSHLVSLVSSLNAIAHKHKMPLIFATHPRTRDRLDKSGLKLDPLVKSMKPMGLFDFVALQKQAFCVVSDSGTISEESSILGFPAITVRQAHERPEGMDEGVIVMSGLDSGRVLESIDLVVHQIEKYGPSRIPNDYNVDQVSWKVVKIICSYTDFVNRRVWAKSQDVLDDE